MKQKIAPRQPRAINQLEFCILKICKSLHSDFIHTLHRIQTYVDWRFHYTTLHTYTTFFYNMDFTGNEIIVNLSCGQ